MSRPLARLPDDTPCYVPGVGEVTLGEVRQAPPEEIPALDEWEATRQMYRDLATRNLDLPPWDSGVTPSATRAYHALRYLSARTRHAST